MFRQTGYQKLIDSIKEKMSAAFRTQFTFADYRYVIAENSLLDQIIGEIETALAVDKLSPTQLAIIESPDTNLNLLAESITGTLNNQQACNIVTGHGFATTGLVKIYFECLNAKLRTFINDLTVNTKTSDMTVVSETADEEPRVYPATNDKLKKSYEGHRKKPMMLLFCKALLSFANEVQIRQLHIEACTPTQYGLLKELASHGDCFRRFQSNPLEKDSFGDYKNALTARLPEKQNGPGFK